MFYDVSIYKISYQLRADLVKSSPKLAAWSLIPELAI